ncbi:MAG: hypothetical protein ACR2K6_05855 [Solirubrobacterales bacterium]
MSIDLATVRRGRVHGRYFRENFAQGGIDLVQILPELVTNADAAIGATGVGRGRIELAVTAPDPRLLERWRSAMGELGSPALESWRWELSCTDDGEGVDAELVDRRLGWLGAEPVKGAQRGLFGRGLRDVWLAQGGGRIEGIRGGRFVESWFFPAAGDDPYAFVHVRDEPATAAHREALGIGASGTRVSVPLQVGRLPGAGRLRTIVAGLIQLRPLLEDPHRELLLALPGRSTERITHAEPEPDPERPVLAEQELDLGKDLTAQITVRRAARPFTLGASRATRPGGLLIRSGRSAHEATLVGHEGRAGARHLYGEVRCEAIDRLQRAALDSPRPEVVVKVDRSGLNENHPLTKKLYAAIDGVLRPIIAAEERRAGSRLIAAGEAISARDQEGLRALNDALRSAFDQPGSAGFAEGGKPSRRPPVEAVDGEAPVNGDGEAAGGEGPTPPTPGPPTRALRFKQSPLRMYPTETRGTSLIVDPARVPPGTAVSFVADEGLWMRAGAEAVPDPGGRSWARIPIDVRTRASVEPGARLSVLAEAGEETAELEILVVRHRASGWVREIVRRDEDAAIEADFDPEEGTVTVYEGRPEFKALERAARKAGLPKRRVREYLPHRMLEVEVAANAVYRWAAERVIERREAVEPLGEGERSRLLGVEAQQLRHRVHEKLMRAFLDPAVFSGRVRVSEEPSAADVRQRSLLDG